MIGHYAISMATPPSVLWYAELVTFLYIHILQDSSQIVGDGTGNYLIHLVKKKKEKSQYFKHQNEHIKASIENGK